jgi:serine protease AprX
LTLLLLCGLMLLAGLPGTVLARPSSARRGVVDPYLSRRAASSTGLMPVMINRTADGDVEQAVRDSGGRVLGQLKLGNSLVAEVPADQLERLAAKPGVGRVAYDPPLQIQADPLDTWSQRLKSVYPQAVGSTSAWTGGAPLRGTGIGVAVLDTGINDSLTDFRGLGSNGSIGAPRIQQVVNSITRGVSGRDDNGHGTFVSGIIAGRGWGGPGTSDDGNYVGIAPDVNLLSLKVSDRQGVAHVSSVVAAIEWVLVHRRQYNIRVLNLSLTSTLVDSYATSVLDAAVEIAWHSGIVVVVAAGNGGPRSPITAPANDPFVIAVGATDDMATPSTTDDRLASFSSYGTTADGISKPDLVAPGRHITSTLSSRQDPLAVRFPTKVVGNQYIQLSGTSAAAPVVTGVVAQLLQARPRLEPGQVKWLLQRTARPVTGAGTGAGYPRVDAAVRYSGALGNTDRGIVPNRLVRLAAAYLFHQLATDAVAWDSVAWDAVAWDSVAWDSVAWDSVAWDSVAWDSVAWDSVAWDSVAWDSVAWDSVAWDSVAWDSVAGD